MACRREIVGRVICFPDLVAHLTLKASLRRPVATSGRCRDNILLRWRLRVGSRPIRMKMILLRCRSQIFHKNNFWASQMNKNQNKPADHWDQGRPNISFTVVGNANNFPSKGKAALCLLPSSTPPLLLAQLLHLKCFPSSTEAPSKRSVREIQHQFIKEKYLVLNLPLVISVEKDQRLMRPPFSEVTQTTRLTLAAASLEEA